MRSLLSLTALTIPLLCLQLHAATYTVSDSRDTPGIPTPNTLRWAISMANNNRNIHDTISFNLPGPLFTIQLADTLPRLDDPAGVFIDGLTQTGAAIGASPPVTLVLLVELDGSMLPYGAGLRLDAGQNVIRGLVIHSCPEDGVLIMSSDDNLIEYNIIGLDPSGSIPRGNGRALTGLYAGVRIEASETDAERNLIQMNVISDNYAEGVAIWSCPPDCFSFDNVVTRNHIGTDQLGFVDLGNRVTGVYIGEASYDNAVNNNLISGNDVDGVSIVGLPEVGAISRRNIVDGNLIGLDIQNAPLPNGESGVSIGMYNRQVYGFANDNTIANNTIAFNIGNGVVVAEDQTHLFNADSNRITQNSTYNNGRLGIDLDNDGVTQNDPGDPDMSANQACNFPVITSAIFQSGATTVRGSVDAGGAVSQAVVEVFQAMTDPSGNGEGAVYLGACAPDNAGNWALVIQGGVQTGDTLTATCTDTENNTSEFSAVSEITRASPVHAAPSFADALHIQVYPSPSSGSFTVMIQSALAAPMHIRLYTMDGKLTQECYSGRIQAGTSSLSVQLAGISPGLYMLETVTPRQRASTPILIW
ncbi:MAG: hypothetical protein CL946_03635 [Ectothiorhodospiraceae bacterium]|nr:hypothetical protein [Ectothiorhodospiraceae bacterium]